MSADRITVLAIRCDHTDGIVRCVARVVSDPALTDEQARAAAAERGFSTGPDGDRCPRHTTRQESG